MVMAAYRVVKGNENVTKTRRQPRKWLPSKMSTTRAGAGTRNGEAYPTASSSFSSILRLFSSPLWSTASRYFEKSLSDVTS